MRTTIRWGLAAVCAGLAAVSMAAETGLPAVQRQGEISYVTGGIGLDEAKAFRAAAAQYNLRLTFAAVSGAYIANAKVVLRDAQGRSVAEASSDGPYLYFKVPAGKYSVTAEVGGEALTRTAQVREQPGSEIVFRWKTPAE